MTKELATSMSWWRRPLAFVRRSLAGVSEMWAEPGDARAIAIYRVLVFSFIADESLPGNLPAELLNASEYSWYPRSFYALFDLRPPSVETGGILLSVTTGAATLAAFGCAYRVTAPIAAILALYWYGMMMNFGKLLHTYYVFSIVAVALSFARASDAWSVDAVVRRIIARFRAVAYEPPARNAAYRWPLLFAGSSALIMYGAAGLTKLDESGLSWIFSDTFLNMLGSQNQSGPAGTVIGWLRDHPNMCRLIAAAGLCIEVGAWAGFFNRTLYWVCGFLVISLQYGIWFLLTITFHALPIVFAAFVPWNYLLKWGDILALAAHRTLASSWARLRLIR